MGRHGGVSTKILAVVGEVSNCADTQGRLATAKLNIILELEEERQKEELEVRWTLFGAVERMEEGGSTVDSRRPFQTNVVVIRKQLVNSDCD